MTFNPLTIASLASIKDVPVTNGVDAADVLTQPAARLPVGSLDLQQVQASLAQIAKDVGQSATAVSADKGVGQYGLSPQQLEAAGFIKPGTVSTYLKDPSQIQSVLGNPAVWTGKNNVGGLDQLLGDVKLQSVTQNEIMVSALDGLKQAGAISGTENPAQLASLVQLGSKFGVSDAVSWAQGQAPADLVNQMDALAKNAQFSVNLSNKLAESGQTLQQSAEGFKATVNRTSVNKAFADILGDPKIPIPSFSPQPEGANASLEGGLPGLDALAGQARSALGGMPNVEQLARQAGSALGRVAGTVRGPLGDLAGATPGLFDAGIGEFQNLQTLARAEASGVIGEVQRVGAVYETFKGKDLAPIKTFISPAERLSSATSAITPDVFRNQPITDLTSRFPFNPRRT